MTKIAVIGAGAWGTALALVLARNGHPVSIWGREDDHRAAMQHDRQNQRYLSGAMFPDTLTVVDSLNIEDTDLILLAVPSHAFQSVLQQLAQQWQPHQSLVWATKGLNPKDGKFLSEIADHVLGTTIAKGILTGPSFATEVAKGLPTVVTVAATSEALAIQMQALFQAETFRVYHCEDLLGAQLGGAVKNVLAIAVGITDGMGFGMNAKAGLMTRGLAEMIRLGIALGAQAETMTGLSGLGDLILTCSDNQSRNRRFGLALGKGETLQKACDDIGQVVEGIQTTETVYHLAEKHGVDMPITREVYRILYEGCTAEVAVKNLLERMAAHE